MSRLLLTIFVTIAAVIGGFYQFSLKPKLIVFGQGRVVEPIGNTKCKTYDGATACEKISLHEPTGHLYMACSTQQSRAHWLPATNQLNATGKSSSDYVAVFDPATSKVTRLRTQGFKFPRGLSVHGMDVVQSALRPSEILIYLINHREPMAPRLAADVGADSVIEIFRTRPGSEDMHYVVTFKDPVISTPNDVVATGDDKSFFFTNDHGFVKSGLARRLNLDIYFGRAWSNVGYCHAENGCKVAVDNISGANGITKDKDGKYYVASSKSTEVFVLERQADSSLVITDVIRPEHPIDNLSVDKSGAIWGAGMVNVLHRVNVHFVNPKINSPSSAFRITPNDGQSRYFGEKYKIEKKFEDDGEIASGSTSVVHDSQRKKLYLHGIAAPHLTVCDIE